MKARVEVFAMRGRNPMTSFAVLNTLIMIKYYQDHSVISIFLIGRLPF